MAEHHTRIAMSKKRAVEVISLDDDSDDELAISRRKTKQRREERQRAAGAAAGSSSSAATAASSSAAAAASSSSSSAPSSSDWARPLESITCPVCFCEEPPDKSCVLASCGHSFCVECLTTFVTGKIAQGEVLSNQLACPCVEPKRCAVPLVPQDVRRCLATKEEADRYERLTLQRCVEAEDDMGTCPSAGCPFMFAWEADNRKLDCPLCKKSFCLVCRTEPWHTGVRCEAFQQQRAAESGDVDAADAAFAQFASKQKLRSCPKCKFWVEKTDGCDAMHCRCNLVFCYVCGGCLKGGIAAKSGIAMPTCTCGKNRDAELRAHEGAPNHNLLGRGRPPPPPPRHAAAMRRAMQQMGMPPALRRAMQGMGMMEEEDDDDDDYF